MNLLFVINPVSGGEDKSLLHEAIEAEKDNHQDTIYYYITTGNRDLKDLTKAILNRTPDRLIAVGGDGTIQLACSAIIESKQDVALGIVPLGSANGLATSLGIPADVAKSLAIAMHANHLQPMDLLKINDTHLCVHLMDIGVNARLIQLCETNDARGMTGYARHTLQAVQESPQLEYTVEANGITYTQSGYLLACTNAHKYGTGVSIAEGSISDGLFEIRIIEQLNLGEAIKAGLTLLNIFIDKSPPADEKQYREATIHINQPSPLQIDGEYIGEVTKVHLKVLPSAVRIITEELNTE